VELVTFGVRRSGASRAREVRVMTLRKCPACRNQFDAESESCPICGCEPRGWWVRRAMLALGGVVGLLAWVMVHHHHMK
jgi:rRNA maturation endonuclease Nob1